MELPAFHRNKQYFNKNDKMNLFTKQSRLTHLKIKLMVTKGETQDEVINKEIETDIYTLLYKQ